MVSVNLYRYKCTDCGCVSAYPTASEDKECPDCSKTSMKYTPSPTHDDSIMEEPPDWFECPNCGQRKYGWPLEDGSDWYCREETGGCGYLNWSKNMSGDVPTPRDIPDDQWLHQYAWLRYQLWREGQFEY